MRNDLLTTVIAVPCQSVRVTHSAVWAIHGSHYFGGLNHSRPSLLLRFDLRYIPLVLATQALEYD